MTTTTTTAARALTSQQARDHRDSLTPNPTAQPLPGITRTDFPDDDPNPPQDSLISSLGSNSPGPPVPQPPNPQDPSGPPDDGDDPSDSSGSPGEPESTSDDEDLGISKQALAHAILNLASTPRKESKKSNLKPNPPTEFSGGTNEQLRTFLFQCELAFNACPGDFGSDREKIFYAISYLRGSASGYFQPYILDYGSRPVEEQPLFLRSWKAFRDSITQQFGSYSPEDDDEAQLYSIPFPEKGRATEYFIKFAQYENRVQFGGRALRFIARQALPQRLRKAVNESKLPKESWEDFKACVLKCDDDYWRSIEQDAADKKLLLTLQQRYKGQFSEQESTAKSGNKSNPHTSPTPSSGSKQTQTSQNSGTPFKKKKKGATSNPSNNAGNSSVSTSQPKPTHIGPDGRLTATERQRRLDNNLCLVCGQSGHLVAECPSAKYKPSTGNTGTQTRPTKGRKARANAKAGTSPETPENK
jgi:hypothetical protein